MIDFEKIKSVYKLGRNLTILDAQILIKSAKAKSFSPGEYLIKEGEIRKEVYLILNGLIRVFAVNGRGDEITTSILHENQFTASTDNIFFNCPSRFYFQAIEPTKVLYLDHDLLHSIIDKNPKLSVNRTHVLNDILKEALQRVDSFVLWSPEERYIQFVQSNPDIINRVPNKYIANILGITPVSLSRMRKRISVKKK